MPSLPHSRFWKFSFSKYFNENAETNKKDDGKLVDTIYICTIISPILISNILLLVPLSINGDKTVNPWLFTMFQCIYTIIGYPLMLFCFDFAIPGVRSIVKYVIMIAIGQSFIIFFFFLYNVYHFNTLSFARTLGPVFYAFLILFVYFIYVTLLVIRYKHRTDNCNNHNSIANGIKNEHLQLEAPLLEQDLDRDLDNENRHRHKHKQSVFCGWLSSVGIRKMAYLNKKIPKSIESTYKNSYHQFYYLRKQTSLQSEKNKNFKNKCLFCCNYSIVEILKFLFPISHLDDKPLPKEYAMFIKNIGKQFPDEQQNNNTNKNRNALTTTSADLDAEQLQRATVLINDMEQFHTDEENNNRSDTDSDSDMEHNNKGQQQRGKSGKQIKVYNYNYHFSGSSYGDNNNNNNNNNETFVQEDWEYKLFIFDFWKQYFYAFLLLFGVFSDYFFCQWLTIIWQNDTKILNSKLSNFISILSIDTFALYLLFWIITHLFRFIFKRFGRLVDSNKSRGISCEICMEWMCTTFYYVFYRNLFLHIENVFLFIAIKICHVMLESLIHPLRMSKIYYNVSKHIQDRLFGDRYHKKNSINTGINTNISSRNSNINTNTNCDSATTKGILTIV